MRRFLFLLILAGCDAQPDDGAEQPAVPGMQTPAEQASAPDRNADARTRAEQALRGILTDPSRARYSEVRSGTAGSVCGRVDSRPFVVTPEGVAVISPSNRVMFDDPEDVFPDYYIRWCASPEELRQIGSRGLPDPLPALPPNEDYPLMPEDVPAPAPAETGTAPVEKTETPTSTEDDSFSRAVLRKRGEGGP